MTHDNGEFKGSTKQAIIDIRGDIKKIDKRQDSMDKRIWYLFILLAVATIERLPSLVSLVMAK